MTSPVFTQCLDNVSDKLKWYDTVLNASGKWRCHDNISSKLQSHDTVSNKQ